MKKTLLALALLIGTSGAFAQVGIKADALQKTQRSSFDKANVMKLEKKQKQNFDGRKDGERTLLCDFSDPTTYTFGSGPRNAVSGMGWNLQPNTTDPMGAAGSYSYGFWGFDDDGYWIFDNERYSAYYTIPFSADNGFAYVSMLDIWQAGSNNYDLEVTLTLTAPIESFNKNAVDIYFNQVLQRFNSERYFIDWSNDPTFATYDSIEFNTRGMEMNANDADWGTKRVTLPKGTYNANSVATSQDQMTYIRFRLYSPANANQPHGYTWFLDDIYMGVAPENRVDVIKEIYCMNAYHLIPEGLMPDTLINLVYLENTGGNDYYDAHIENQFSKVEYDENDAATYTLVSANVSEPDTLSNTLTRVFETNDAGVVTDTTEQRYVEFYSYSNHLPYSEVGNYIAASVVMSGNEVVSALDDTTAFAVVGPMLNDETCYQWAKDRNVLVEKRQFSYGFTPDGYLTDEAAYTLAGYEVCLPYSINQNNTSERWIKGIEVVPAADSCRAGAAIQGKLRKINPELSSLDDYVIDVEDAWGNPVVTPVYEVQESDLNNGLWSDDTRLEISRDFTTIFMEFPNSVKLEPNEVYYACYRMAETGKFAVATDDPGLGTFGPGDGYYSSLMLVCQSNFNDVYAWGGRFYMPDYSDGRTPMIRMIVGTTASLPEDIAVTSSLNVYPNPANNDATISYSLNKSGNVEIVITDIMGRTVKTMNQGNQVAGTSYNVNLSTSDLANGTYFYTLTVNGEKQTKKFVVNR